MVTYAVLSLNPETKIAELMAFECLGDAESHEQRALREGRVLVEVVSSVEGQMAWRAKARAYLAERFPGSR